MYINKESVDEKSGKYGSASKNPSSVKKGENDFETN